ncbi:MAG: hypothetical protein JRM85_05055 [Nitrososphaerota archaeon]|jgi:hypothetical protein|nr:hypothetical protein [Nitrososphaerota archaeon]
MGNTVLESRRPHLSLFLRRWLGPRKNERIRLSPLKVLLYLERHQRETRVTTPERLGREIGIGGYDTIKNSYVWLHDHGYLAPAPSVPMVGGVAEILDPRDWVVTPLGKKALKPYLAAFSLEEVGGIALTTLGFGFVLGLTEVVFQLYPSYLWILLLFDFIFGAVVSIAASSALREARSRKKDRVASLIESITDRG